MVSTSKETPVEAKEDKSLLDYELVLVFNPEMKAENTDPAVEKINRLITDRAGVVSKTDRWGKKKLAYPIKYHLEGEYVLIKFKSKPEIIKELDNNVRITEEIIRHLIVKLED